MANKYRQHLGARFLGLLKIRGWITASGHPLMKICSRLHLTPQMGQRGSLVQLKNGGTLHVGSAKFAEERRASKMNLNLS